MCHYFPSTDICSRSCRLNKAYSISRDFIDMMENIAHLPDIVIFIITIELIILMLNKNDRAMQWYLWSGWRLFLFSMEMNEGNEKKKKVPNKMVNIMDYFMLNLMNEIY